MGEFIIFFKSNNPFIASELEYNLCNRFGRNNVRFSYLPYYINNYEDIMDSLDEILFFPCRIHVIRTEDQFDYVEMYRRVGESLDRDRFILIEYHDLTRLDRTIFTDEEDIRLLQNGIQRIINNIRRAYIEDGIRRMEN